MGPRAAIQLTSAIEKELNITVSRIITGITATAALLIIPLGGAGAAYADDVIDYEAEGVHEAELDRVEYGEDVVVLFPQEDGPANGAERDYFSIGPIDDDMVVVIADSQGNIPGGLSEKDVDSLIAEDNLSASSLNTESQDIAESTITPQSTCNTSTAYPGAGWDGVNSSTAVIGWDHTARINYTHQVQPGTNQSAAVRGRGYEYDMRGNLGRVWVNFGITGEIPTTHSAPWGEVSSYPRLEAYTTTVHLAAVGWCH